MTASSPQRLEVVWTMPDGVKTPVGSTDVRIEVAQGVLLDLVFAAHDSGRIEVDLTLSGQRPLRGGTGTANPRFVIIPLSESALLLAVAEPSAAPADLMPVPSTPVWITTEGGRLPARGGSLTARRPDGGGVDLEFAPGPGQMTACILQIRADPGNRESAELGRGSPIMSIRRLSEEVVRLAVGPAGDDEAAN